MDQKAIITLTDTASGKMDVSVVFEPDIDGGSQSPAAHYALSMVDYLGKLCSGEEDPE